MDNFSLQGPSLQSEDGAPGGHRRLIVNPAENPHCQELEAFLYNPVETEKLQDQTGEPDTPGLTLLTLDFYQSARFFPVVTGKSQLLL